MLHTYMLNINLCSSGHIKKHTHRDKHILHVPFVEASKSTSCDEAMNKVFIYEDVSGKHKLYM